MDQQTEVLIQELKDQNEILKIQNDILMDAIKQANFLMSAVPLWNAAAQELADMLSKMTK